MANQTNHNVNVNVTTTGANQAAGQVAGLGNAAKKVHNQTMNQGKQQTRQVNQQLKNQQQSNKQKKQQQQLTNRELKDLRQQNKLYETENKIRRERLKLIRNEEMARRKTLRGGFAGGFKDRFIGTDRRLPQTRGEAGEMLGGALGTGLRAVLGTVAGMIVSGLTRLVSMPFQAIGAEYEAYRAHAGSLAKLAGYAGGGATNADVDLLRKGAGAQLGYMPEQVVEAMAGVSRATGSYKGTESALALSRLLGMDVGETTGIFGALRQAGARDFTAGGDAMKQLTKAVAAGVGTGLEKSRMPEFLTGVMDLTSRAAGRTAGDVSTANFTRLMAALGSTGASGLTGARGAAVARALEEGFTAPGGGEEGRAIAMAAMGFGKIGPGGGASFYEATSALEQGTAGDPDFIRKMIEEVNVSTGGGEEANLAIREMLGGRLTLKQIEEVQQALVEGRDPDAIIKEAMETERDVLIDIRSLLSGGNDDFLHEARRTAKMANEDITEGEALRESLETMHEIMRQFIHDVLPTVKTTLEVMAGFATEMRPVLHQIANVLNSIASLLPGGAPANEEAVRTVGTAAGHFNPMAPLVRAAAPELADRIDEELANQAESLYEWATGEAASPLSTSELSDLAELASELDAGGAFGEAAGYDFTGRYGAGGAAGGDLVTSSAEDALLQAYDRIARSRGFSDWANADFAKRSFGELSGATDTRAEFQALLLYVTSVMGVTVPPSVRGLVDGTGGVGGST